ncbi:MAG: hypothetical protein ACON4O_05025 [Lentimonas sp.]
MSFVVAGYYLSSFFSVLSTIRILFVIYLVSNVSVTLKGLRQLGVAIILVGLVNIGAALVSYYHVQPFDLMLLKLYTSEQGFEKYSMSLLEVGHLNRPGGTMANPNYLGFLFSLAILASVDKVVTSKWLYKILSGLCIGGFLYTIAFILQSRSSLIIAAFVVSAYLIAYYIKKGNVLGYVMLFVITITSIVSVVAGFAFAEHLPRRVAAIFQASSVDDFLYRGELLGPRMNIWTDQFGLLSENSKSMLFGHLPYGGTTVSDNCFINVWYRAGVFGFAAYSMLMVYLALGVFRLLRRVVAGGSIMAARVFFLVVAGVAILVDLTADSLYSAKWGVLALTLLFLGMSQFADEQRGVRPMRPGRH